MATTVATTTLYEGGNIIVKKITATGDETAAEQSVIDLSTLTGPGGLSGQDLKPTGQVSLMEASWNINPLFENVKLYWHDEANDSIILTMSGDSAISFRGIGGLHYGAEAEAGDGDVLFDATNATETANGSADITLVFKKKE